MAKVLFGFLLGLAVTTFAVEKHKDGSVTYTGEEMAIIVNSWVNMELSLNAAGERIRMLESELKEMTLTKCM